MKTVILLAALGAALAVSAASAQVRDAAPPLRMTLDEAVRRGL